MLREIPYARLASTLPPRVRRLPGRLRPVLPDTGIPLQLVHEADAGAAFVAAAFSEGDPGAYNVAAPGTVTVSDLARLLGWRAVRVPRGAIDRAAAAARLLPAAPGWLEVARTPILVDTERARSGLGWAPRHTAMETLEALASSYRRHGLCR
jgi:UDP-glucose 4-epimerase